MCTHLRTPGLAPGQAAGGTVRRLQQAPWGRRAARPASYPAPWCPGLPAPPGKVEDPVVLGKSQDGFDAVQPRGAPAGAAEQVAGEREAAVGHGWAQPGRCMGAPGAGRTRPALSASQPAQKTESRGSKSAPQGQPSSERDRTAAKSRGATSPASRH